LDSGSSPFVQDLSLSEGFIIIDSKRKLLNQVADALNKRLRLFRLIALVLGFFALWFWLNWTRYQSLYEGLSLCNADCIESYDYDQYLKYVQQQAALASARFYICVVSQSINLILYVWRCRPLRVGRASSELSNNIRYRGCAFYLSGEFDSMFEGILRLVR